MRDDDVQQLLAAYRAHTVPDAPTRSAMRARLDAARRHRLRADRRRIVVAVMITSAIAAALLLLLRGAASLFTPTLATASREQASDEPAAAAVVQELVPAVPPPPPPVAAKPEAPTHSDASPRVEPRVRTEATPRAPASSRIAEEAALLLRAKTALREGELAAARAALDEYAREFPVGRMARERAAIAVMLHCREGGGDEARARARELLDEREQASYAAGIRSACGL
ncbi:MAG TPA: hypothetical protein VG755_26260 [Nannocystaceae bacterium]|nr:hypothetical protein [Nannocystaceae bacterium]